METKIGMRNGKPWEKEYPLLGPRYLFVGALEYPWQLTHNIHLVNGFVQQEGEPAVFSTKTIKSLDRIIKKRDNDSIGLTVRHKAYRIGQPVRITTPPFEGHSAHVLEIERARIRVLIDLLGSPQAVWLDWEGVENV
jgi:transcription antitermination factor NusG